MSEAGSGAFFASAVLYQLNETVCFLLYLQHGSPIQASKALIPAGSARTGTKCPPSISIGPFGPISLLEAKFKLSEYFSMPLV
jgi:hypothetical protein